MKAETCHPERKFLIALCALVVLLCLMLLAFEWRAVFRCSATASAMVGIVLVLPAGFATVAEIVAVSESRSGAMYSPAV